MEQEPRPLRNIHRILKEHGPLQRSVSYPKIPVLYFEAMAACYLNNPLFSILTEKPTPIAATLLDDTLESWTNPNLRPTVRENSKITEINKKSLEICERAKKIFAETLIMDNQKLRKPALFINALQKINELSTEIYWHFTFFIDESFEANDEQLIHRLQKTRMRLDDLVANYHFKTYDKFINILVKYHGLPKETASRITTQETIAFLSQQKSISELETIKNRPIAFVHLQEQLINLKGAEVKKLRDYLNEQDPHAELIDQTQKSGFIKGTIGNPGKARGKIIKLLANDYQNIEKLKKLSQQDGFVLVIPMTGPELVPYFKKAAAFITDEGGLTCHAAIIAREMNIPCIVGTKIATQVLKNDDLVKINADDGIITILERTK